MKARKEEFQRDIAPILVDFVWGPDNFGYESSTDMFQRSDGVIQEREILTRITDLSRYPERWKEFMGYNVESFNGYERRPIPERVIVNEPEGSPLCPIDVSSDEEEEFVPAKLDMSDDEDDE
jgi:hypothetical protein